MTNKKNVVKTAAKKKSPVIPSRYVGGAEVETSKKADAFPMVSVLPKADMARVIEILQDDTEFAEQINAWQEARTGMRDELMEIYKRNKIKAGGLRWGPYTAYIKTTTRKSLSATLVKEAWVEAGMDAADVDGFYVESKEFADIRIVDARKPKGKKDGTSY